MKAWLAEHLFNLIAGPVVGILVYLAHENLQKALVWLKAQPAWVKRGVAIALSAVITPLASAVGANVPEACVNAVESLEACLVGMADQQWLTAALGSAFAFATHKIVKLIKSR